MFNRNSILKIIYNFNPFENCACIILNAVTRVNLPFCHNSMTVICEVGPQRCVMCIKNKKDILSIILYINICNKIYFVYKIKLYAYVTMTKVPLNVPYICIITVPVFLK